MDSEATAKFGEELNATPVEPEAEEREDGPEAKPDLAALAKALTWEGYGSLDVEGRRRMIGQLWTLYASRKLAPSGCQTYPTGE